MANDLLPLRLALISVGLVLPALSLLPLGSLWLWEHGYVLHWVVAALILTLITWVIQWHVLGAEQPERIRDGGAEPEADTVDEPEDIARARAAIERVADNVSLDDVSSWQNAGTTAHRTIEAVARAMHVDAKDPELHFTLPEALLVIEQTSARLRPYIERRIPFGRRLTVAQVASLYRWRGLVGVAGRMWDIWRVLRLVNPTAAATQELRERMSRALMTYTRDAVGKRLAQAFVREVGTAAVDLYSGRLRGNVSAAEDAAEPIKS